MYKKIYNFTQIGFFFSIVFALENIFRKKNTGHSILEKPSYPNQTPVLTNAFKAKTDL